MEDQEHPKKRKLPNLPICTCVKCEKDLPLNKLVQLKIETLGKPYKMVLLRKFDSISKLYVDDKTFPNILYPAECR